VSDIAFYETVPAPIAADDYSLQQILEGRVSALTFTSSSTVTHFMQLMAPYEWKPAADCRVVCIGPVTADTAREAGFHVSAVAEQATIEALVHTLLEPGRDSSTDSGSDSGSGSEQAQAPTTTF
jgi:hypothetical protein